MAGALSVCGLYSLLWPPPLQWQTARILGISRPYFRGRIQFEAEPRKFVWRWRGWPRGCCSRYCSSTALAGVPLYELPDAWDVPAGESPYPNVSLL